MKKLIPLLVISFLFIACNSEKKETADTIINKAIDVAGGKKYTNAEIHFNFRGTKYTSIRKNETYQYQREFKDSIHVIHDVLNNDGFTRFIDDKAVTLADSMAVKYEASVNSVHYFALLPYGLNDKAVLKSKLGAVVINGKNYHKIKVTFQEEGGGEDFDDVFVYWVNKESYTVDFLAYSYQEDSGIGMRFREAYNARIVNGLRFVDYNNFKPADKNLSLLEMDKAFENGKLKLLSTIELKDIRVK
ncbi:deoxyribose-phosphate aldolase [Lacinutrix sp. C3R15]|uniref:DUF6503 family protein n=1 Tax=Flavobacteriaceae TaxID=49546 RepID=UPI001C0A1E67|nr:MULTISPECIES: DUF6503 family protein [Flavobacteriaceae]MBU2940597.1 deoxyribose-phosphate aldolase [Lacinutrix sp. C3R15]MDO6623915.1 deoxyribose-phosphate aldolase [Oceanihabitans sp. 1_MG-2023]